jgi:glutathione S-transferase
MKIYDFPLAPNPTKLRVYMIEKGIEIPRETVDLLKDDQNRPDFLAINPLGAVPVLELGDGTHICQSLAIMEYLEELHPDPPMIGRDPLERARVRELERTIDIELLMRVAQIVHNTRSPLPGFQELPEVAERERNLLPHALNIVDERIGHQPYAAGDHPTIADCTLFAALGVAPFGGIEVDETYRNIRRWFESFGRRPSAQI